MKDVAALAESLHPHEAKVLKRFYLSQNYFLNDEILVKDTGLDAAQVSAALGRLQLKGLVNIVDSHQLQVVSLTQTGQRYAEQGSPLNRILRSLQKAAALGTTITIKTIQADEELAPGEISGIIGDLKQEQVINIAPGGVLELTGRESKTAKLLEQLIQRLKTEEAGITLDSLFQEFENEDVSTVIEKFSQKRGNRNEPFRLDIRQKPRFGLTPLGKSLAQVVAEHVVQEEIGQLTHDMLKDGSWRNTRFRKYTIGLKPARIPAGKKHPYREFLDLVKAKLVGMGFEEMRGPLVENEFWDMDALYMPQFHPARDIHDVYFIKEPPFSAPVREPFLTQVSLAHEHGWKTGSTGWGYSFEPTRTHRLVLRSQGTAVSARTLAAGPKVPGKYFSIARCFRYDQVDATHAADFYQIEGIVLGPDINFRTLLGLLTLFAREMAQARESRFLPAYFPFTEPSVELHVRHPRLGWMELGGAGLFRPEVTRPLGVDVPVIAWGLGLDRMAMVALEIHDIRDLFSSDLEMIRSKRVQY